jgi:hypothetical protein
MLTNIFLHVYIIMFSLHEPRVKRIFSQSAPYQRKYEFEQKWKLREQIDLSKIWGTNLTLMFQVNGPKYYFI